MVALSKVLKLSCEAPVSVLGDMQGAAGAASNAAGGCKISTKPTWLPRAEQPGCLCVFNMGFSCIKAAT